MLSALSELDLIYPLSTTYLEAHRTASSLWPKKGRQRLIVQTSSGVNTELHAVKDTSGRPIHFFITAGQVSDYTGATALRAVYRMLNS